MQLPAPIAVARQGARAELRSLIAAPLLGVAGVVLDLARPWPLALAIDALVAGHGVVGLGVATQLALAAVAVVVLTAAAGWIDMLAVVGAENAAERVGARLRGEVFDRAMALSPRWHDRMRSGELTSRLTSDVGRVLDALVAFCSTMVPDVTRLVLVLAVLLMLNPPLVLVAVALLPVLAVLAVRQRRRVRSTQAEARAESGRFTAVAVDLLRNVRAAQVFDRAGRVQGLFRTRSQALLDANVRAIGTEARWAPLADVTLAAGSGLVLLVGGRQVLNGGLSVGDLIVVTSYVSALYSPVRGLSRLGGVLAKSTASAHRIAEVLSSPEQVTERAGARPAPWVRSEVRLSGVRFGYDPSRPVLDGIDLVVRAGETVCLLGPSGVGKSTILQLILRLFDVDAGAVCIDGVDVRDVQVRSLRERIAFVPQDPWLLDTTIADNIAFGSAAPTRHGILRAARLALVDEFADRLPNGYDSPVGEGANQLSGGQRRRIALARAAISAAPLVLLDEPTASLDPASAAAVIEAITRSTADRTVLIVTHDIGLARIADRVITVGAPSDPGPFDPSRPREEVSA